MREPALHFGAAPWSGTLKAMSVLAALLLAATALPLWLGIPDNGGHRHPDSFAFIPLACLAIAALFMVTGYTISPTGLVIHRLLWSTVMPLPAPVEAMVDPAACTGSMRLFGNGGLFVYAGWFRNQRLGRYRAFATNFAFTVVLRSAGRTIVITPDSPAAFVDAVAHCFPRAATR